MGKKLIIKGADFSLNSINVVSPTWFLGYSDSELNCPTAFSSNNTFYITPEEISANELSGKTVEYVKCYCKKNGTISICNVTTSGQSGTKGTSNSYPVYEGINTLKLITPITLSSSNSIGFQGMNILSFGPISQAGWNFRRTGATAAYDLAICIDFGALEIRDAE